MGEKNPFFWSKSRKPASYRVIWEPEIRALLGKMGGVWAESQKSRSPWGFYRGMPPHPQKVAKSPPKPPPGGGVLSKGRVVWGMAILHTSKKTPGGSTFSSKNSLIWQKPPQASFWTPPTPPRQWLFLGLFWAPPRSWLVIFFGPTPPRRTGGPPPRHGPYEERCSHFFYDDDSRWDVDVEIFMPKEI